MKKKYLLPALAALSLITSTVFSQSIVTGFENFTLQPQSYYQDSSGTDFSANNIVFQYDWDQSWNYWSGGFVYSNITDSSASGFGNQYAAKALTGYNGSSNYAIAQNYSELKINTFGGTSLAGFYITNTTYAANSMRDGDAFAKQFGGPTGNDPDWFKLTVWGYNNSIFMDSVEFYLADYRFSNNSQDYIVKDWQWLDLNTINTADSLVFMLSSSDVGSFGMNTPAFFAMDDFTTPVSIGIKETTSAKSVSLWPNPTAGMIHVAVSSPVKSKAAYRISDMAGREIIKNNITLAEGENAIQVNMESLEKGIYYLQLISGTDIITRKIIKE